MPAGDYYSHAPVPQKAKLTQARPVDVVVKWFNPDKGFGFVEAMDGSGDAFLHIRVLKAVDRETVSAGAKLSVVLEEGGKGPCVSKVITVDETAVSRQSDSSRAGRLWSQPSSAVEVVGTVKWYSEEKGMGFAADEGGGSDVFLHAAALRASGWPNLSEGQRVLMRVVDTEKGRKAVSIALAG
jgi:cold shock protein